MATLMGMLMMPRAVRAHDLPGASATLVVRDGGFVELRLQLPWSELLQRQWMPRATPEQFLTVMVNQPPAAFAKRVLTVQAVLARELRVIANGTRTQPFTRWRWPSPAEVQNAMRTELMARLAMPGADHHAERMLVQAEVRLGSGLSAVQLQTAALLGPTLLTTYRPSEQWVGVGARSAPVPVGRP
jgi:hypothetical protein